MWTDRQLCIDRGAAVPRASGVAIARYRRDDTERRNFSYAGCFGDVKVSGCVDRYGQRIDLRADRRAAIARVAAGSSSSYRRDRSIARNLADACSD